MAKKTQGAVEQEWLAAHECASRIGLTVRALRLYEQRGLIRPRRTDKGWRLYGAGEIARLHEILALKRLGLSLSSIVALLQGKAIDLERILTLQSQALSRQRVQAERGLALVETARATLSAGHTLSIEDLITLAKETNMTELTPDSVARRRYEQARPRTAVRLDPALFERYVGHYRHPSGAIIAVERCGDSLFGQLTGQPALELFAEAEDAFFLKAVPAQIGFAASRGGAAPSLTLSQEGFDVVALRIDTDEAAAQEAAIAARVRNRTPHPGSEAALRAIIVEQREGRTGEERMSRELAIVVGEQFPFVQAELAAKGDLRQLVFKGVEPSGPADIYEAQFANGKLEWGIGLADDGKVHALWLTPSR
ncbi:MerR family transcriptional regulator [Bosea sp. NPDC055594]